MYTLIRSILFLLPPERAHYLTMSLLGFAIRFPFVRKMYQFEAEEFKLDGLIYKNKVGLAAGFDKDGKFLEQLYALNFGFIEVGTVTPKPQSGNPKPRLFRLPADHALINRMGFNNEGVGALEKRLKKFRKQHRSCDMQIGINIGKNKLTPNTDAAKDYSICYEALYDLADFFVVNVSSPNTPNLRDLQTKSALRDIIEPLLSYRAQQDKSKPLYLKIAPDLSFDQLDQIIELQTEIKFDGIVATNTSIDRTLLKFSSARQVSDIGDGGLSGAPILEISNSFVSHIRRRSTMTIIGVGGIENSANAKEKFYAGADLIELYTGFIYSGPKLIKRIATS